MFIPHDEVVPWSATEVAALRLRNSQQAAILRIPSETLVSIFRQVIKTSPGYEEAVQLITSICYSLRALVFGTPELWGFVNMRGSLGPLFLERCHWNPTSVVPYFMEADEVGTARIYACLNLWKNAPNLHLTRVELVEFCGTSENFAALSWIFDHHMPNLKSLTLASGALVSDIILDLEEEPEAWVVIPNTQRTLKHVYLQHIFVPWRWDIFYGLSTLHLDYRGSFTFAISIMMDPFLELLSQSPRLEKCSLYFAIPHCYSKESLRDTRPTRIVSFPLLEELTLFDKTLNVAYLLRHLQFPTTTKITLKLDTPPEELDGLLSTLFPSGSSTIDLATEIALQHHPIRQFRPALEIGHTSIQYLNHWHGMVVPNEVAYATFILPLVEAVHRVGPQVRVLDIRLYHGFVVLPEILKHLLEHLPNLEDLTYMPGEGGIHQWPSFWDALSQIGENGLICQSLRKLRINNTRGFPRGFPPDTVRGLAARWKLERPLEVFHVRLQNCERPLAQLCIAHLSPFVAELIFELIEGGRVVSLTD